MVPEPRLPYNSAKIVSGKMRLFTYYKSKMVLTVQKKQPEGKHKQIEENKKPLIPVPQNTRGYSLVYIFIDLFLFLKCKILSAIVSLQSM